VPIYAFDTSLLVTNLPIYFSALLAPKSMQDPCKFTLNSAAKPLNLFETLSLSLVAYRRDLNLNAADFKPQPKRIVSAAARRASYQPRLGALF